MRLDIIQENKDQTQTRMAELWGNKITQQNISYACIKLGITRKKTYRYEERNEEEREFFSKELSKIARKNIVYVDEAGFNNRENHPDGYSQKGERC